MPRQRLVSGRTRALHITYAFESFAVGPSGESGMRHQAIEIDVHFQRHFYRREIPVDVDRELGFQSNRLVQIQAFAVLQPTQEKYV